MHVLLIAYHFPPFGGGGTQRSLKFARYLPERDYDVTVLTGPGTFPDRWSPTDSSLLDELAETPIRRLSEPEPAASGRWAARAERWLGLRSPRARWWSVGVERAGLGVPDVDVVLASMPPYGTAEAAAALARKLGVPWVADLRDPWAVDEMTVFPTWLHRRRELVRMRRLLTTASAVVTTTEEAARRMRRLLPGSENRLAISIPNGFDRADFEGRPPGRRDDRFRIVHAGSLHTDVGLQRRALLRRLLGGSARGVDLLPRSHVYLLEAVDRILARDPGLRSHIEVVLAGELSQDDRRVAERSPVARPGGYLSHGETIALMRTADLLFLPMYKVAAGARAGTVPGKTYEYLAAERPILAAVPEGDVRDIVSRGGRVHLCAPDDVQAMAGAIESELARERQPVPADEGFLQRFERRALTGELASVLDAVTAGGRVANARARPTAVAPESARPAGAR
jgi:glycosyltransferase involved in cell wall biosynthesis